MPNRLDNKAFECHKVSFLQNSKLPAGEQNNVCCICYVKTNTAHIVNLL